MEKNLIDRIHEHENIAQALLTSTIEVQNVEYECAKMLDGINLVGLQNIQQNINPPYTSIDALEDELLADDTKTIEVTYMCPNGNIQDTIPITMTLDEVAAKISNIKKNFIKIK